MLCRAGLGQKAEAGAREKAWSRAFIVFSAGKARQAREKQLRIGQFECQWALDYGVFSSCLVPGSG